MEFPILRQALFSEETMSSNLISRILFCACFALAVSGVKSQAEARKIGVIYAIHGGAATSGVMQLWESSTQIFSYDPNNSIFKRVLWNPEAWPTVANFGDEQRYANVKSQSRKYAFQNKRVGGVDPARVLSHRQFEHLSAELVRLGAERDIEFVTDWASWITGHGDTMHYPYPRSMYYPQVPGGSNLTYCGSESDGGVGPDSKWPGCDPERYNVDGPAERLLAQGAEEIIVVDSTTSGVRFVKTYEVVEKTKMAVKDYNEVNGTNVKVYWVNDPTSLMEESHPIDPEGWTRSLGAPNSDVKVPLEGRPNPVSSDPALAALMVDGVDSSFSPDVADVDTAVLMINHTISNHNESFDPKVNDTLMLNGNIREELLKRHPDMDRENIISAWMGIKVPNPNIKLGGRVTSNEERSREMRAESLGRVYLYETDKEMPTGLDGFRYWDGLEYLKSRGVKHIVVIFPQIVGNSVLNLVEVPNQIAKEIGFKTWLQIDALDFDTYPGVGHPFADYWGVWLDTQCKAIDAEDDGATEPCCFEMGGCKGTNQPYPPLRQTPIDQAMGDLDPSLAFDVSAYGHLGYDPALGPPDDNGPVQDQYRGTWAMWSPLGDDPRLGKYLAGKVMDFIAAR
jgi:hypothetical protein